MVFQHRLFQGATRSPETARPRQVPPTQQPSRSPAKERASQPNSASDDFSKLPCRRRHVRHCISFWLSGRALDPGRAERQFKSPCLCFFAFFVAFFSAVREFKPPSAFDFDIFLLYCCTYEYCCCTAVVHTVGSWVVVG